MIVYSVMPILFWNGWQNPIDMFPISSSGAVQDWHDAADWTAMWTKAQELASKLDWTGDISIGPFVTVLPEAPGSYGFPPVIIAWKQGTNGPSFIATPFELPWVAEGAAARIEG